MVWLPPFVISPSTHLDCRQRFRKHSVCLFFVADGVEIVSSVMTPSLQPSLWDRKVNLEFKAAPLSAPSRSCPEGIKLIKSAKNFSQGDRGREGASYEHRSFLP